MVRGLYTSATGMLTQQRRMDVVANNLANVNTTGHKRDFVVVRSFSEELSHRINDDSDWARSRPVGFYPLGLFIDDVYTDHSVGAFQVTGGALDLALTTQGFFVINTVDEAGGAAERFTRAGSFTLGPDNVLMTKAGGRVQGESGDIVIPNGEINIDRNGFIYSNGELVDRLRLVDFTDTRSLRKVGDNLFATTPESVEAAFSGMVEQGYLERSNVNSVREMVEMITLQRIYDANSRLISVHDRTLGNAVNDIARR